MNKNQYIVDMLPDIKRAARRVAREWADVIDADDAEQEIALRILDLTEPKVRELYELDRDLRISVLIEIGHQIGMKYRDDYELFSGNYTYGTRDVRRMLDNDALAGAEEGSGTPLWELPESVIAQLSPTETETVSERIDLFMGMKKLADRNSAYYTAITNYYVHGIPLDNSNSTERSKLQRAVDALTREMNNSRRRRVAEYLEGPGSRESVSGTRSRHIVALDYNGDILEGRA